MTRTILISILLLTLGFGTISLGQNLEPKKGFQAIYIGMNVEDLKGVLGTPTYIVSLEDEKQAWVSAGYNLQSKIIFHIGFDYVYKYEDDNAYGIWKAYIKDEKIVYMSITAYSALEEAVESITINETIKFGNSIDDVVSIMGDDYMRKTDERDYTEIIYMDLGLRFIFTSNELNHVYIFAPIPKSEEKLYRENF